MKRFTLILTAFAIVCLVACGLFGLNSKSAYAAITLEITSEYGDPTPSGTTEYNFGDPVEASVQALLLINVDVSIICIGWTGTGSAPATGTSNSASFTIYINSTITWRWAYEYTLRIYNPTDIGSCNPPVGTYRFTHGTEVSGTIPNFVEGYVAGGFTGTGSAPANGTTAYFRFVITQPSTVTWRWNPVTARQGRFWGEPATGMTIFGDYKYSNLIYDPMNGIPRTFYYEPVTRNLIVAYFNGLSWNNITIDSGTDVGKFMKAIVAPNGVYHVAYHDAANGALKYATSPDGFEWTTTVVDPFNNAGRGLDIGLDEAYTPWISYFAPGLNELRLTHKVNNSWVFPTVVKSPVVGTNYIKMAYNALTGLFEIAYQDGADLRGYHAYMSGENWIIEPVPAQFESFMYVDCAVSPSGQAFFAYQELAPAGRRDLKLSYKSADNWYFIVLSVTGDTGYFNNLSFDAAGFPVVYSLDKENEKIRQYYWNGIQWLVNDVAPNVAFQPIGLTTDFEGELVLYYYNVHTMLSRKPAENAGDDDDDDDDDVVTGSSGGCFIATAAFGSISESSVKALTSFRDGELESSALGSSVVNVYYAASPFIANAIRNSSAALHVIKGLLY